MQFSDETQSPNPSILEKNSWKDVFSEKINGEFVEKVIQSPASISITKNFSNKLSTPLAKSLSQNKNKSPRKA
ncbi:hypothetical protein ACEW7V_02050 [Areca yellow leaf disease phytoplasma]|uniref:hypothetical protein n=1 Tax=Areca yellow leaf disease phytoplasma TaxID=927614 RepID=UPI0035B4FFA3